MNFKKIFAFIGMLPLLVACNNSSISGVYSFQMGKEAGTHFGVYLNLKDEAYVSEQVEAGFKKFDFSVNVKVGTEDIEGEIEKILSYFADEKGNATVPGYYKLENKSDPKGESLLTIGLEFSYIVEKLAEITKEETGQDVINPDSEEINALNDIGLIRRLLYATYGKNTVNFYIPVSISDALFQLYWYGTDVQAYYEDPQDISTLKFQVVDSTIHDFGTTPTEEEIAVINETYPAKHTAISFFTAGEADASSYRIFHQVKLGLTKK